MIGYSVVRDWIDVRVIPSTTCVCIALEVGSVLDILRVFSTLHCGI